MYLVDTSIWIDYTHGAERARVTFLDQLLSNPLTVGLNDLVHNTFCIYTCTVT